MKDLLLKQASAFKDRHDAFVTGAKESFVNALEQSGAGISKQASQLMVDTAISAVESGDVDNYLNMVKEASLNSIDSKELSDVDAAKASIEDNMEKIASLSQSKILNDLVNNSELSNISDIFEKVANVVDDFGTKIQLSEARAAELEKAAEEADRLSKISEPLEKLAEAGYSVEEITQLSQLDEQTLEKVASAQLGAPVELGSGAEMASTTGDPLLNFVLS